ncbi:DUF2752 domain-containing protein [Nocardia arizonensis]|uniref:DUF2752 domain-containing protein n=1 Tax=Nocardia arizonensis TaxID=1141647 RepID=UPI001EF4CB00|nr:DUF2752 domain-containing protein [Nocardia arizonensis]
MDDTHVAGETIADAIMAKYTRPPEHRGWRALPLPLLTAGVGVGAVALLHFRDPHVEGAYGMCPVYALTGMYCPGCGGMRAVHNLTDGRIVDALHSNLIAVPLLFGLAFWVGAWGVRAWRGQRLVLPKIERTTMWLLFGLIAVYSVVRNTPWGGWLTPV